jgi:hypothetical protein
LLSIRREKRISFYTSFNKQKLWALRPCADFGLFGKRLWSPSEPRALPAGAKLSTKTSGEGGRFYQYPIILEIISITEYDAKSCGFPEDNVWMNYEEINSLINSSMMTSLELRLVWSLVLSGVGHGTF